MVRQQDWRYCRWKVLTEKTWEEFRSHGLLWLVNRTLHIFGWAIVFEVEEDGSVSRVYPSRTRFRGFCRESEEEGFVRLSEYMDQNASELLDEARG